LSQIITLSSGSLLATEVTLVSMPQLPGEQNPLGLRSVQFGASDAVAIVSSPFTGQTQRQQWLGADMLTAKCALMPLYSSEAAQWKSWLMAMRGMANAVQLGDPDAQAPKGIASSRTGVPVCNTGGSPSTVNIAGSQTLQVRGFAPNLFRLLDPGDAIQVGYRMYYVVDEPVNSNSSGDATINIWPTLREQPPDGTAVILNQPKALFGLASNMRNWSLRPPRITDITSIDLVEFR
jgi:hypothetical protein